MAILLHFRQNYGMAVMTIKNATLLILLLWLGSNIQALAAPSPRDVISRPINRPGTNSAAAYTNHNWQTFRQLPQTKQRLEPGNIDLLLLDMAVFHETNRQRQQHRLPPLVFDLRVRQLAQLQSRAMAEQAFVGHENPAEPEKKTMSDRVRLIGLNPAFVAENVANAFARQYKSGRKFYIREENGQKIYSYTPQGPNLPMHTYITFAEALVDSWMNSPGHRKNILHSSPQFLGCSCEPAKKQDELFTFYCTQNFFTPL
jgi:uncharacterized protein YkwD